jgi:hypothetical protein
LTQSRQIKANPSSKTSKANTKTTFAEIESKQTKPIPQFVDNTPTAINQDTKQSNKRSVRSTSTTMTTATTAETSSENPLMNPLALSVKESTIPIIMENEILPNPLRSEAKKKLSKSAKLASKRTIDELHAPLLAPNDLDLLSDKLQPSLLTSGKTGPFSTSKMDIDEDDMMSLTSLGPFTARPSELHFTHDTLSSKENHQIGNHKVMKISSVKGTTTQISHSNHSNHNKKNSNSIVNDCMVEIEVLTGPYQQQQFALSEVEAFDFTIGSDSACTICLENDHTIFPIHLQLQMQVDTKPLTKSTFHLQVMEEASEILVNNRLQRKNK